MHSVQPGRGVPEAAAGAGEGASPGGLSLVSLDHLAAIVESSDDAILSKDRDGIITSWNPAAARIYGYTEEEAIGKPISILIPAHRSGEELNILNRVLAGERVDHYETERVTKDGQMLVVSLTVSPIRGDDGLVGGAAVIARDVSERRRSDHLAEELHRLTAALSKEVAADRAIEVLIEGTQAALGGRAGTVGLLDETGTEIELAGSSGHSAEGLAGWERFPLAADVPMAEAIRKREAICTETSAELRERYSGLERASVRFGSLVVVPLEVEGRPIGALSLSFPEERVFGAQEQAFLAAVAGQAAATLERARLYEAQRLSRERLAFLAEASELLGGSLDPDQALQQVAELAVQRIADWCGIELVDEDGGVRNVMVAHVDPDQVRMAHELRTRYPPDPDAETGVPNVIRTGQPEIYPEVPDEMLVEAAQDDEHLRLIRELGLASAMIVPLIARDRVLGAVTMVSSDADRQFDDTDLELAQDLARRAAMAIDNAILFRREHEAAVTLQRSLLPQSLPQVEGMRFAARYEPAAPGLEVGGDWYEVVALADGTVGASIGDVAGHGINAASMMGRIRPALRAYVLDGHGPLEAVRRLDRLMRELGEAEMTTVFHVQIDPRTDSAEYVRAGHMPALLRLPGGEIEFLEGAGTPPLGIIEDAEFCAESIRFPPGSLLVLYTDGLIERRDMPIETGLERLRRALAAAPGDPEACLEALVSEFKTEDWPDDVALLAVARD